MKQETSISIDKFKLIKKNGESIILEGYASSKFENINPLYTRGIFRDITEVSKTSKNLEILTYITQKLNETNNPEEAYRTALDKVIELDNVDIASIYIVDKQSNEAVLVDHRNLSKQYLKRASRIPFPKGLTWKLINTGKILNVKNIQNIKELGKAGRKLGIRSFVGIPININKKTIGVFWLLSIKEHSFNKNEVSLLNSIGNQIAISIARSTIYGELVKKNRYDEIISSVVKSVHSSIDLQEVFENTVNALINNIDIINHVGLHIVEKDIAVMKAYRGHPKWFVDIVKKLKRPRGFTWKTINNGKLYYCSDVSKDDAIGPAGRKVGTKSYVSVPIKIEQNTIGCINVHSNLIDPFSKDELTLLEKVTSEIAIAINNAKYVDELNKKKHYDEIISSVVNSVHSSIDLQQVFENTVEALINNIKVINHVGLHIVEGDVAVMRAYRGHPKWFVDIVKRLERPRGFTWKTIIDSKLHYCPDVSKDKAIGPAGRKVGTNSYISVPITISAKTIGCINVHSKLIDPFGEGDLKLLENVTNQIAVAIDNARQAEQLKDSEKSLKENIELLTKKQRLDEISNTILQSVHKSLDVKTIMHNAVNAIT
ncbi:MAG: GAF domain-containing protein, partial [Nitrosopumilaceae archaeon]|nr:GAF domain-containing protein [Nitrosopumilaceae archaeon]